jgi:GNAT superfamily N-acetyltransferase
LLLPWNAHRVFLAGAAHLAAFNRAAAEILDERYRGSPDREHSIEFVVYNEPGGWDEALDALLPGFATLRLQRQYWRLEHAPIARRAMLPAGMRVRSVDAELLAEGLLHTGELIAEIHSESHSVEDFLLHKLGSCMQVDGALAAWCLSEYNRPGRCELGIETLEPYRRRGLATIVACATIERARGHGIAEIGWHCWASNAASIAVAKRVGFEKARDYAVWYCRKRDNAT